MKCQMILTNLKTKFLRWFCQTFGPYNEMLNINQDIYQPVISKKSSKKYRINKDADCFVDIDGNRVEFSFDYKYLKRDKLVILADSESNLRIGKIIAYSNPFPPIFDKSETLLSHTIYAIEC